MRSILKKIAVRKKYKENIEAASIPQTFEWQPTFLSTRLTSSTGVCTLALRLYSVVNLHSVIGWQRRMRVFNGRSRTTQGCEQLLCGYALSDPTYAGAPCGRCRPTMYTYGLGLTIDHVHTQTHRHTDRQTDTHQIKVWRGDARAAIASEHHNMNRTS